jgi:MFS family permease
LSSETNQTASPSDKKTFVTFRALSYPSFRYLWAGQLGSSAANWMEQVMRPLLVLELTDSAFQVGLVLLMRMIPQLFFGLLAGVIADRYDKRRILMACQTTALLTHLTLALLLLTGHLEMWHVYVTAMIIGASLAFNDPARQSIVPRLVPQEIMLNALSLNTSAQNIMRVLGASLAGLLLIFFNYGEVYLLNVVIYVAAIWATTRIQFLDKEEEQSEEKTGKKETRLAADFVDGFRYISKNPILFYLVGLGLVIFMFGQPYTQVFVPLLATDVLGIGRSGTGLMLALTGVGALIGSLTIASTSNLQRRGLILMVFLLLMGISLVVLAQSHWLPLSALALVFAGGSIAAYLSLSNSLLLEQSTKEYHGRVMCLMSLDRGLVSLGSILAGGLAELYGPQIGLTVFASISILITILVFLFVGQLRNIN